jgi:hypothetical protein
LSHFFGSLVYSKSGLCCLVYAPSVPFKHQECRWLTAHHAM